MIETNFRPQGHISSISLAAEALLIRPSYLAQSLQLQSTVALETLEMQVIGFELKCYSLLGSPRGLRFLFLLAWTPPALTRRTTKPSALRGLWINQRWDTLQAAHEVLVDREHLNCLLWSGTTAKCYTVFTFNLWS